MSLDTLKEYELNPRKASKEQLKKLQSYMEELGDLGGVIHEENTDSIIGGNQRVKIMSEGEIEITESYKKPTKQGTTAIGWIIWKGERYSYRKVKWSEEQTKKANIIANKFEAGEFDWQMLHKHFDRLELADLEFTDAELANLNRFDELLDYDNEMVSELTGISDEVYDPQAVIQQQKATVTPNADKDSTTGATPEQSKPQLGYTPAHTIPTDGPKASMDDYSRYEIVMLHTNKVEFVKTLTEIKNKMGFDTQEESIMHLVRNYAKDS